MTERDKSYGESKYFDNASKAYGDDYCMEAEILHEQIDIKKNIRNLAVVAGYSAGKSSVIKTYLSTYREKKKRETHAPLSRVKVLFPKTNREKEKKNYVHISLSNFNDEVYDETKIEQNILKQLLYSRKKLPHSNLKRTNKPSPYVAIVIGVLFAALILFSIKFWSMHGKMELFSFTSETISFYMVLIALSAILTLLVYYRTLKRIVFKGLEIDLYNVGKDGVVDPTNQFIDEILHFFECKKVDLVIFEDIDRFKETKIFIKLHELNTVVNGSKTKAEKVTFLYAVKDDLFETAEDRAKFFDFILHVVPIVNPLNTKKKLDEGQQQIQKKLGTSEMKMEDTFIKRIADFIPNMRIRNNTLNDYAVMFQRIIKDKNKVLNKNNLFAICLYKNLYPLDYALLEQNLGLIPMVIVKDHDKNDKIIEKEVEEIKNQYRNSEEVIRKINQAKKPISNFTEVSSSELELFFEGVKYRYEHYFIKHKKLKRRNNKDNKDDNKDVSAIYVSLQESEQIKKQLEYVRFLAVNGYVDERYLEYTADYEAYKLSPEDNKFVMKIRGGFQNYDYVSQNFKGVIEELDEMDFERPSILNREILLKIEELKDIDKEKYNGLKKLLSKSKNEDVVKYIKEIIHESNDGICDSLFKTMIPDRLTLCEEVFEITEKRDLLINCIIKYGSEDFYNEANSHNVITKYLNENENYEGLFRNLNNEKVKTFLRTVQPCFKIVFNQTDEIQKYIIMNKMFELTFGNLKMIFKEDPKYDECKFCRSNMNSIQSFNTWPEVKDYIYSSLESYVKGVILNGVANFHEESGEVIISLLNGNKISKETLDSLIANQKFKDVDIMAIRLNKDWSAKLIEANSIKFTWSNVNYAISIGMDAKDLKNYVIRQKTSASDIFPEALLISLLRASNANEVKKIVKIIPNKEYQLIALVNSNIEDDVLSAFIKSGRVPYLDTSLRTILNKEKSCLEYIKKYKANFIEKPHIIDGLPDSEIKVKIKELLK